MQGSVYLSRGICIITVFSWDRSGSSFVTDCLCDCSLLNILVYLRLLVWHYHINPNKCLLPFSENTVDPCYLYFDYLGPCLNIEIKHILYTALILLNAQGVLHFTKGLGALYRV